MQGFQPCLCIKTTVVRTLTTKRHQTVFTSIEEKEMLHKMGYNIYQGYLYSAAKPLLSPIAENEKNLVEA